MKAIVAIDERWGIGKNGDLLFHIKDDMKRFKELTEGNVVIMGRKTFDSLPNREPLKNRVNIVLSTDETFNPNGVTISRNDKQINELIRCYIPDSIFIIGGTSIYSKFIDMCDVAYVTKVFSSFDADRFFPNLDLKPEWYDAERSDKFKDIATGLIYQFITYKKYK